MKWFLSVDALENSDSNGQYKSSPADYVRVRRNRVAPNHQSCDLRGSGVHHSGAEARYLLQQRRTIPATGREAALSKISCRRGEPSSAILTAKRKYFPLGDGTMRRVCLILLLLSVIPLKAQRQQPVLLGVFAHPDDETI